MEKYALDDKNNTDSCRTMCLAISVSVCALMFRFLVLKKCSWDSPYFIGDKVIDPILALYTTICVAQENLIKL